MKSFSLRWGLKVPISHISQSLRKVSYLSWKRNEVGSDETISYRNCGVSNGNGDVDSKRPDRNRPIRLCLKYDQAACWLQNRGVCQRRARRPLDDVGR